MPFVSTPHRLNFNRIMAQLMKTVDEKKVMKIFGQAQKFLVEHDIGWDAVTVRVSKDYVAISERRKRSPKPTVKAAVAAAHAVNGAGPLGFDGRGLLKRAIVKHPDWPTVRETLSVDMSHVNKDDLIAIAQLLGINEAFLKLFVGGPAQAELFTNGKHNDDDDDEIPLPPEYDTPISKI